MKFEITIPDNIDLDIVMNQVREMHDVALHNLGNGIVRKSSHERIKHDTDVATATRVTYDIMSIIVESISAMKHGENPEVFGPDDDVICRYISDNVKEEV